MEVLGRVLLLACVSVALYLVYRWVAAHELQRERAAYPQVAVEEDARVLYAAVLAMTTEQGESFDADAVMNGLKLHAGLGIRRRRVCAAAVRLRYLVAKRHADGSWRYAVPLDGPHGLFARWSMTGSEGSMRLRIKNAGVVIAAPHNTVETVTVNDGGSELIEILLAQLALLASDERVPAAERDGAQKAAADLKDAGSDSKKISSALGRISALASTANNGFEAVQQLVQLIHKTG